MSYSTDYIPKSRRKKRAHFSGFILVCIAFLAFILIGLTVSLSIRACSHDKKYSQKEILYEEASKETVEEKYGEATEVSIPYEMPDSVVRICMPKPLEGISEQVIRKKNYIVSYNKDTKIPNWVAWHLTAEHVDGTIRRFGGYVEDEEVPPPRATKEDYKNTEWTHGHMCPAADCKWDSTVMLESNLLTNICPQHSNLNTGLWNKIEQDCRRWTKKYGDVYIVCGPLLLNKEHELIGENRVVVPEAFFKVVICLHGTPKGIGFMVRNNEGKKKRDQFINTIDEVERITGYNFFSSLPDSIEDKIEAYANIEDW